MISRRLFLNTEESYSFSSAVCKISFDSTPVKSENIMSVLTPEARAKWTPEPDEDSGLGMDDYATNYSPVKKPSTKRKHDQVDNSCFKRHRTEVADIKEVVNMLANNSDLVADGSRRHVLPTIPGKHNDLKSITPEILSDVINGHYKDAIDSYRIIDCRYPYEYEGGHIRDAENMYLHETILTLLQTPTSSKQVLIFHCEFSSERGPKMLRFLRSKDRELNKENYPALNFPEIYLLDGGYKAFFNEHPDLCDPISYRPMLHSGYSSDLRHFRSKSKSWTAGEKKRFARKVMRF